MHLGDADGRVGFFSHNLLNDTLNMNRVPL